MTRSSTHTVKCPQCTHAVTLTLTGLTFVDKPQRYVDAIAEKEGWDVAVLACPQHRAVK
jgi:hypothetical protein